MERVKEPDAYLTHRKITHDKSKNGNVTYSETLDMNTGEIISMYELCAAQILGLGSGEKCGTPALRGGAWEISVTFRKANKAQVLSEVLHSIA